MSRAGRGARSAVEQQWCMLLLEGVIGFTQFAKLRIRSRDVPTLFPAPSPYKPEGKGVLGNLGG